MEEYGGIGRGVNGLAEGAGPDSRQGKWDGCWDRRGLNYPPGPVTRRL